MTPLPLPAGVRARFVDRINGLRMHILEAGWEPAERPMLLLLHGYPELAWSWRKVIAPLAEAGFHVVAPDTRGYGRTTGADTRYEADLHAFSVLNLVRDAVGLVHALRRTEVAAVIGHDYGAGVAAACALARPDLFRAVALTSAPFAGPPPVPAAAPPTGDLEAELAALDPPRKHYFWYNSTAAAANDWRNPPEGLHRFLRAYYHHKSADWPGNTPHPLAGWSAAELAKLPTYYVMHLDETMPQSVARAMPGTTAPCPWLPDEELAVYVAEYERTGFGGGLNWYRQRTSGLLAHELSTFAGRTIDIPACYLAGTADWGTFQKAGDFEAMRTRVCTDMRVCELIDGAGHWVQQERPADVVRHLLRFLHGL